MTSPKMPFLEWLETVAFNCPKAMNVRGGAMCRGPNNSRDYCSYDRCPNIPEGRK